jgi:hypothetical protein
MFKNSNSFAICECFLIASASIFVNLFSICKYLVFFKVLKGEGAHVLFFQLLVTFY